jgi:hypothetical protein
VVAIILRLLSAGTLLLALVLAARVPLMPGWLVAAALLTLIASAWRPAFVFPYVIAVAPFGELAAGVPIRATETVVAAFFAGWLLRLHEPLDPGGRVPRSVLVPAATFAAIVVASWAVIYADRSPDWSVSLVFQFPPMLEYFARAGRDPQTEAAVLLLMTVAICLSVPALSRRNARVVRHIAIAVAAGGSLAAAMSLGTILAGAGPDGSLGGSRPFIDVRAWRHSVHLADVNAAGSHFALAAVTSLGLAAGGGRARVLGGIALVAIAPSLWLTGSRIAVAGALAGAAFWAAVMAWRERLATGERLAFLAPAAALATLAVGLSVIWMWPTHGKADWGLQLRAGFAITSARMLASAPVFGVGVGRFRERSVAFMPPVVRQAYPRGENAHNYFAQVIAELGLVGGGVFLWWIGAVLYRMWRGVSARPSQPLVAALVAASAAYLVTCLTGHPLLVVGAAVPFWAVCGAGLAATDAHV